MYSKKTQMVCFFLLVCTHLTHLITQNRSIKYIYKDNMVALAGLLYLIREVNLSVAKAGLIRER